MPLPTKTCLDAQRTFPGLTILCCEKSCNYLNLFIIWAMYSDLMWLVYFCSVFSIVSGCLCDLWRLPIAILVRQTPEPIFTQSSPWQPLANEPSGKLVRFGQTIQISTKAPAFPIEIPTKPGKFAATSDSILCSGPFGFPWAALQFKSAVGSETKLMKLSQNAHLRRKVSRVFWFVPATVAAWPPLV